MIALAAAAVAGLVAVAILRAVDDTPVSPGPYVDAGAAALVCAVLLRPAQGGGRL